MGNLLRNPPKHDCPKCHHACDYYLTIGNYGIFSCTNCEKGMGIWQSFAYAVGVCLIAKWIMKLVGFSTNSTAILGGVFVMVFFGMMIFMAFGNYIWTFRIKKLDNPQVEH